MTAFTLNENETRLLDIVGGTMFIAVDDNKVNLDDLLDAHPGKIVRCDGNPRDAISLFDTDPLSQGYGCVAGWISEAD